MNTPPVPVRFLVRLAVAVALLALPRSQAQANPNPPERLTYQGFLVDANGNALATTAPRNFDVVFRIYDQQSGGAVKWAETQTVTVDKGYFSVLLGEGSQVGSEPRPALSTVFAGPDVSERYVAVTVKGMGSGGADLNILPRLRLLTSPYAFLARQATALVSPNGSNLVASANGTLTVNGTIAGDGSGLTNLASAQIPGLDAAKIVSGTLAAGRIPNLSASLVTSGTLADARLSSSVALRNADNTFSVVRAGDASYQLSLNNGSPTLQFDANDYLQFDRSSNLLLCYLGGSEIFRVAAAGINLTDKPIYFRSIADTNHGIGYVNLIGSTSIDGPNLWGYAGGTLGTRSGPVVRWTTDKVGIGTLDPKEMLNLGSGGKLRFENGTKYVTLERSAAGLLFTANETYQGGVRQTVWDGDGNLDVVSDRRLKKDIEDAEPVLERLMELPVRRFRLRTAADDAPKEFGLIAQEVQPLFPDLVGWLDHPDLPGGSLTVGYSGFGLIAAKAVQELKSQTDAELTALRAEVEHLRSEAARAAGLADEVAELRRVVQSLVERQRGQP